MALINCPHCGKPISDKAVKCPHCGKSVSEKVIENTSCNAPVSDKIVTNIPTNEFIEKEKTVKPVTPTKVEHFGFYKYWLFVLIGVGLLWGLYAWDVLELHNIFDDYQSHSQHMYYNSTMTAFLVTLVLTLPLIVVKDFRKPLMAMFGIAAFATLALLCAGAYDRFNPSEGYGQFKLSEYYYNKNDFENQAKWVRKAAEQNYPGANVMLGDLYYQGKGVEKNYQTALKLFKKEIELNNTEGNWLASAYNDIGYLYQNGLGVEKDEAQAREYYLKALSNMDEDDPFYGDLKKKVEGHLKELNASQAENAKAQLSDFKNFRSNDLSAFMLHGKVKTMTEYSGGQGYSKCVFDENGKLIRYEDGDNHTTRNYNISHDGNKLIIEFVNPENDFGGWAYAYTIDNAGRLVSSIYGSDDYSETTTFSNYDANGWPTKEKTEGEYGETQTSTLKYSDIDKCGNWTKNSNDIIREIEYYPAQ